jgi:hypothetical protein
MMKADTRERCIICDDEFFPPQRNYDPLCGECDNIRSNNFVTGDCGLCGTKETTLIHKDVAVCLPCTTSEAKRADYFRGIIAKQKSRIAQYGATVPPVESATT